MRVLHAFLFLSGIALGVVMTFLLLPPVAPRPPTLALPPPSDQTESIRRLRATLDDREAEVAQLRASLATLQDELASAQLAASESPGAPLEAIDPEEARAERRERGMQRGMLRWAEREADDLVNRLQLTAEQEAAIRAHFAAVAEFRIASFSARNNGEPAPTWDGPATPDALAAILDPAQFEEYSAYDAAVRQSRAETGATARMNAIAPDLALSEAQKDQVFSIYYNDIQGWFDEGIAAAPSEDRQAALAAEMQQVLTPEQYGQWLQLEQRQRRWGPPRP